MKRRNPKMAAKSATPRDTYVEGLTVKVVVDVPIGDISPEDAYQYRLNTKTSDLKESLLREGQREPVDLMGSKPYKIVDGYRRVAAIRELGWPTVKAFVHKDMTPSEAQRLAFLKNVVRKNLSPLDKANAISQAKRRGRPLEAIAKDFGISVKQVRRYEALLDLPNELQDLVDKKELPMAHAKLLADFGAKDLPRWTAIIAEDTLSAAALGRILRKTEPRTRLGRKRQYVKLDKAAVRLYPFTLGKDAPRDERLKVAKLLEEAASELRKW